MNDRERMWRLAGRYSSVGLEMAIAIAIGTLGGRWLDGRFGWGPWGFWIGLSIGIGAAVRAVLRITRTTKLERL